MVVGYQPVASRQRVKLWLFPLAAPAAYTDRERSLRAKSFTQVGGASSRRYVDDLPRLVTSTFPMRYGPHLRGGHREVKVIRLLDFFLSEARVDGRAQRGQPWRRAVTPPVLRARHRRCGRSRPRSLRPEKPNIHSPLHAARFTPHPGWSGPETNLPPHCSDYLPPPPRRLRREQLAWTPVPAQRPTRAIVNVWLLSRAPARKSPPGAGATPET